MRETRIKHMADFIAKQGSVSLSELSDQFDISIYTVRRDINDLAERGIVSKRYGGVTINQDSNMLIQFEDRNTINKDSKMQIAKLAAASIDDNDIIFIDSGTTTMYMANFLADKNVTLITNNIYIITKVFKMSNIKLIVLGGEVDKRTDSIVGIQSIELLKNLNINKAFLACSGVSNNFSLTNYTVIESELKGTCVKNSEESYLLADSSKFGTTSLVSYGMLKEIDIVFTERPLVQKYFDYCNTHGVNIVYK